MARVVRSRVRVITSVLVLFLIATSAGAQALPIPWTNGDIGSPAVSGDASIAAGTWTVIGGGSDIWGSSDQFQFVYQQVTGDVDIVARVDGLTPTSSWSKAGVMIRGSLAPNAAHGYALVSAGHGLAFQRRVQTGGPSTNTSGEQAAAPRWVRLVRHGSTVTAYSSADGASWTTIGSDTVQLGSTVYVGLAVTSRNKSAATTATISNVAVAPLGLPSGQADADIGSPTPPGSATYSAGTYAITAGGADIWGDFDQFHYVYQPVSGDVDVAFHLASLAYSNSWAKAGVMIRETLDPASAHAYMLISAGRGYAFQRRPAAGGVSVNTSGGPGAAPGWIRLARSGDLFSAYRSRDGVQWTLVGTDTIPMAASVYVGIAVTSHASTASTTAVGDTFTVSRAQTTNQPPTVSLTAPANGATFTAASSITLTATASDPQNQLTKVEFYNGTTLLGTATASPYSFTWPNVATGVYSLTAVAYDAAGLSTRSAAVGITVAAAITPVSIAFAASPDHATLVTNYVFEVFAANVNTTTATPLATLNLGKPTPDATNTITVDITTFFNSLAAGNYRATVSAVGSGGSSRSTPVTFTK